MNDSQEPRTTLNRIGIMQGRLTPPPAGRFQCFPRDTWADEFPRAAACGLACIEWIYDELGADVNPLASAAGIARMKELAARHSVVVESLCADYFMERPLVRVEPAVREERIRNLCWLLGQCHEAGIRRIVLPLVDNSRIDTAVEAGEVSEILRRVLPQAAATGVELHLESSLPPDRLAAFLASLPSTMIRVNYDSGNSASLGYDPREEFAAYGTRIGSVHVKDRKLGGGTVPLDEGDCDLATVFAELARLNYTGDFILQVARGTAGDEVGWTKRNVQSVRAQWAAARAK
jgi:L-ribulose-5-phosphate 3-epimerase